MGAGHLAEEQPAGATLMEDVASYCRGWIHSGQADSSGIAPRLESGGSTSSAIYTEQGRSGGATVTEARSADSQVLGRRDLHPGPTITCVNKRP